MNGVSLVMATLRRVDEVRRFVEALNRQSYRSFELIVVDQNPDDRLVPVLEEARRLGIATRHLRQAEPNLCLARNTGLKAATLDIVAFPDDDCWYDPDTLQKVVDCMSGDDAPAALLIRWEEQDPRGEPPHRLDNAKWRAFRETRGSSITQFFQRRLFDSLGGFDPSLGLHSWFGGAEETDLMFRILASGASVHYRPEPLVHHAFTRGLMVADWRVACRLARGRARGTGALYAKHRLAPYVILRGFLSPVLWPLWRRQGWGALAQGLYTTLGRLEGFCRWHWNELVGALRDPGGRRAWP